MSDFGAVAEEISGQGTGELMDMTSEKAKLLIARAAVRTWRERFEWGEKMRTMRRARSIALASCAA